MPSHTAIPWFDTHLDLAYIALAGRDMYEGDLTRCGGPDLPAAVTLPSLAAGNVKWCLATIFTETGGDGPAGYPSGDSAAAHQRGTAQLAVYEQWERDGRIARWSLPSTGVASASALRVGILVEGADPISGPEELSWWVDRGVVAVGLAWAKTSRYAGGNGSEDPLSDLGRGMIMEMDRLGIVHDVSHLSDNSLRELLERTDKPVIASHSNCRALIDVDGERRQRHLTDEAIGEIARRGGVIGVNIYSPFIIPGALRSRRATLKEWAAHVNRICDIHQSRKHVGLGTDMDGGFSAATMPGGIDKPADLHRLCDALGESGWSDVEIRGFAFGNWMRFWSERSPRLQG